MTPFKLGLFGVGCIVLPVSLLTFYAIYLNCVDSFQQQQWLLAYIDTIVRAVSWTVFLIPAGLFILFIAYVWGRLKHGISKIHVFFEMIVFIIFILVIGSLVLASLNTARNKAPNASTLASLSGLRATAEIYYDHNSQSYDGLCASADVTEELNSIKADKRKQGRLCSEAQREVSCFDSPDSYAISTVIYEGTVKKYWCVDSQGFYGGIIAPVTGTSCR